MQKILMIKCAKDEQNNIKKMLSHLTTNHLHKLFI